MIYSSSFLRLRATYSCRLLFESTIKDELANADKNNAEFDLMRGFDDIFYVPHSRHTEVRKEDIEKVEELMILSESEE